MMRFLTAFVILFVTIVLVLWLAPPRPIVFLPDAAPAPDAPSNTLPTSSETVQLAVRRVATPKVEITTRQFAAPGQRMPAEYLVYGVIAFGERHTDAKDAHWRRVCEAFVNTLPQTSEVRGEGALQHGTIWPVTTGQLAFDLSIMEPRDVCKSAVRDYDFGQASAALTAARKIDDSLGTQIGPYLIAWSPGQGFDTTEATLLVQDLTDVESDDEAKDQFRLWIRDIEQAINTMRDVPWHERLRLSLRSAADGYGPRVFMALDPIFALLKGDEDAA